MKLQAPLCPSSTDLSLSITAVATEAHTMQVHLAWELLCAGEVDAVVAHRQPSAIEASRTRAADVHHHAIQVAIHAMRNLVFMEKAQTLGIFCTFSIGSGGMQMGNYLKHLADIVDHIHDSLEWQVVTVEEALNAEDGIVATFSSVDQAQCRVPWVAADLVCIKSLEDGKLGALQFHVP